MGEGRGGRVPPGRPHGGNNHALQRSAALAISCYLLRWPLCAQAGASCAFGALRTRASQPGRSAAWRAQRSMGSAAQHGQRGAAQRSAHLLQAVVRGAQVGPGDLGVHVVRHVHAEVVAQEVDPVRQGDKGGAGTGASGEFATGRIPGAGLPAESGGWPPLHFTRPAAPAPSRQRGADSCLWGRAGRRSALCALCALCSLTRRGTRSARCRPAAPGRGSTPCPP